MNYTALARHQYISVECFRPRSIFYGSFGPELDVAAISVLRSIANLPLLPNRCIMHPLIQELLRTPSWPAQRRLHAPLASLSLSLYSAPAPQSRHGNSYESARRVSIH